MSRRFRAEIYDLLHPSGSHSTPSGSFRQRCSSRTPPISYRTHGAAHHDDNPLTSRLQREYLQPRCPTDYIAPIIVATRHSRLWSSRAPWPSFFFFARKGVRRNLHGGLPSPITNLPHCATSSAGGRRVGTSQSSSPQRALQSGGFAVATRRLQQLRVRVRWLTEGFPTIDDCKAQEQKAESSASRFRDHEQRQYGGHERHGWSSWRWNAHDEQWCCCWDPPTDASQR